MASSWKWRLVLSDTWWEAIMSERGTLSWIPICEACWIPGGVVYCHWSSTWCDWAWTSSSESPTSTPRWNVQLCSHWWMSSAATSPLCSRAYVADPMWVCDQVRHYSAPGPTSTCISEPRTAPSPTECGPPSCATAHLRSGRSSSVWKYCRHGHFFGGPHFIVYINTIYISRLSSFSCSTYFYISRSWARSYYTRAPSSFSIVF
jgi:hypothetical protein